MERFTVDTHLFRELGELLVGRDSTALIELIKNSYDADATKVVVHGESLNHPASGVIKVVDDGTGMTHQDFVNGFLRIASRGKEQGDRRSKVFGRRFTGAKGIGRLAAHKLARSLIIESIAKVKTPPSSGIAAVIDWDKIEGFQTLEDIDSGVDVMNLNRRSSAPGTTITLRKLRRRWSTRELTRFINEVQTLTVPSVLLEPPRSVASNICLFKEPTYRDVESNRHSFKVVLEGDFAPGAEYWQVVSENADWLVEIDASKPNREVKFLIAPTARAKAELPDSKPTTFSQPHPKPTEGPFFQARILIREGRVKAGKDASGWLADLSGVRIFMEGFRVLPYGDTGNDWLSLDADYTRRSRKIDVSDDLPDLPDDDPDAGLLTLPNRNYFGGVFLTGSGASSLRMLVNREGFVPEGGFEALRDLLRNGIALATRARAAARLNQRQDRQQKRSHSEEPESKDHRRVSHISALPKLAKTVQNLAHEARELIAKGDLQGAQSKLFAVNSSLAEITNTSEKAISEAAMIRVLASVGTQMAEFVHEINSLLGMAESVEKALQRLQDSAEINVRTRRDLAELRKGMGDLRRNLERHASYLVDVITPDARRRRSRQSLASRFDSARQLVQSAADRKGVAISNNINLEIKSPPMFPAELTTIFSNLLSNAVKAAGPSGKIRASSKTTDSSNDVLIENTGARVNVKDSERWFKPFESTTLSVDPVLGQGMGLGLTITRNMLEQYGATIRFVPPSSSFTTAIFISFPV